MEKKPFEKIRSVLVKKEIFEASVTGESILTIKFQTDELFQVQCLEVRDDNLIGRAQETLPTDGVHSVLGFLTILEDRYFLDGKAVVKGDLLAIPIKIEAYRLERRKTLRVQVPDNYPIKVILSHVNQKLAYSEGLVVDVSGGGFKFRFLNATDQAGLAVGQVLAGTIHVASGKTIPFEGEVRHRGGAEIFSFGIEVKDNKIKSSHRLMALSMDLQQRLARSIYE